MKIKRRVLVFLTILVVILAMAVTVSAQRAGFQAAGITPVQVQPTVNPPLVIPGFSQPMVVPFTAAFPLGPFAVSPVTPFVTAPVGPFLETFRAPGPVFFAPVQAPVTVSRPGFRHHPGFGQGFQPTIPVNTVIINVPPAVQPGVQFGPVITNGTSFAPSVIPSIPVGTTRSQVIAQFGQPSVTVVTSTGETLYFNGGATVIIQNGQVVTSPR